jgi:hypothetical protein
LVSGKVPVLSINGEFSGVMVDFSIFFPKIAQASANPFLKTAICGDLRPRHSQDTGNLTAAPMVGGDRSFVAGGVCGLDQRFR